MKLEKKVMYVVQSYYEPEEMDVILNGEEVFLVSLIGDDDFYSPGESSMFFDTKEEADKFYHNRIPRFDKEEMKRYIEFLWTHDRGGEILPDRLIAFLKEDHSALKGSYAERRQIEDALRGVLNVAARSFRVSDISYVKYGQDWLSVILKDGEEIVPTNSTEVFIIQSVFGNNNSRMIISSIVKPE